MWLPEEEGQAVKEDLLGVFLLGRAPALGLSDQTGTSVFSADPREAERNDPTNSGCLGFWEDHDIHKAVQGACRGGTVTQVTSSSLHLTLSLSALLRGFPLPAPLSDACPNKPVWGDLCVCLQGTSRAVSGPNASVRVCVCVCTHTV